MTPLESFEEILADDEAPRVDYAGCNVLLGLEIVAKYLPKEGIVAADHDIVYSVEAEELVTAGISVNDAITLRNLNWTVQDGILAIYV